MPLPLSSSSSPSPSPCYERRAPQYRSFSALLGRRSSLIRGSQTRSLTTSRAFSAALGRALTSSPRRRGSSSADSSSTIAATGSTAQKWASVARRYPRKIDRVEGMESDALFVLLVEKDAAFMRLAEDRFYNRFPYIIVTAKGQLDVATRLFLRKIRMELMLPVLALVDFDPYGLKILSVYMCGSKNMSYDSSNLTTPGIKWLGVRQSDLDKYGVPEECRLPMTEQDVKTGKDLLEEDFSALLGRRCAAWNKVRRM